MKAQRLLFSALAGLVSLTMATAQDQSSAESTPLTQLVEQSTSPELSSGEFVVIYENGHLTIKATRVPLLQVLRRVCKELGAQIEAPSGASEPIVVDLGPGPVREVLTSLLAGSPFNYAMQAADDDPRLLARLLIIPLDKHGDGPNHDAVVEARAEQPRITPKEVTEPEQSAAAAEVVDAKQTKAEMKNLLAEAKAELAASGADMDESLKQGASQLLAELEKSMDTLVDKASASTSDAEPSPAAPAVDKPTGRRSFHHRH
jgi:hypothetical protein